MRDSCSSILAAKGGSGRAPENVELPELEEAGGWGRVVHIDAGGWPCGVPGGLLLLVPLEGLSERVRASILPFIIGFASDGELGSGGSGIAGGGEGSAALGALVGVERSIGEL